jgi:ApbE superfamily uncharacterized protein (UPF0280 family)
MLHLQHGPTDLIITANGASGARERAFTRARVALNGVIEELVGELSELRRPATSRIEVRGQVARRMVVATAHFASSFVTPMAAVAGAIADHVLEASWADDLERLTINNGGDVAFGLAVGASTRIGVVTSLAEGVVNGSILIDSSSPVRGVATSGWRGRSFSMGIADAVTVLARDAATADAAATVVASAVDLPGHPGISRVPASQLDESSDLGWRLVTRGVEPLSEREREAALEPGVALAESLLRRGVIEGAHLTIAGTRVSVHRGSVNAPFEGLGSIPGDILLTTSKESSSEDVRDV